MSQGSYPAYPTPFNGSNSSQSQPSWSNGSGSTWSNLTDRARNAAGNAGQRFVNWVRPGQPSSGSYQSTPSNGSSGNPPTYAQATNPSTNPAPPTYQQSVTPQVTTNGISQDPNTDQPVTVTMQTDGVNQKYHMGFDITRQQKGTVVDVAALKPGTKEAAFSTRCTVNLAGEAVIEAWKGEAPPHTANTAGGSTAATGPNGEPIDPNNPEYTEPPDGLPSFYDMTRDTQRKNMVYGLEKYDLSKIQGDTRTAHDGSTYAEYLWSNGEINAFDSHRKNVENTAAWIRDRYRWFDEKKPDRVGSYAFSLDVARQAATKWLDMGDTTNVLEEIEMLDELDKWAYRKTGGGLSVLHDTRPTEENGLGSASSLAWNGSSLSEWVLGMTGEPELYNGYSGRQVVKMRRLMDSVQALGDDTCEALGLSAEDTALWSSRVGTWATQELVQSGNTKLNGAQQEFAAWGLAKNLTVTKNLDEETREIYNDYVTGRISLDELREARSEQNSTEGGNTTNPSTVSGLSSNTNSNTNSNTTMADRLRPGSQSYLNNQTAQQQQNSQAASYGIPSTMQTGTNLGKPSSLKGGKVRWQNQLEREKGAGYA